MTVKNYYFILGVPHSESSAGIKSAYRDLAKKHHPDRVGPAGAKQFCQINEAYETLSDADKREAYDAELERGIPIGSAIQTEAPRSSWKENPEPLIPASSRRSRCHRQTISVCDDWDSVSPSMEALVERFVRNYTGLHVPKGERLEALNIDLGVSAEEAAYGVELPIGVPTFRTCLVCRGTGRDWLFPCMNCMSLGLVQQEEVLTIRVPPFQGAHAVFDFSIGSMAIKNFWLRLNIHVR